MNTKTKAIEFAVESHGSQKYGQFPYKYHLECVVGVLDAFNFSPFENIVTAAWLHDVVEDTDTTLSEVTETFGEDVADLVWRVTDAEGKNRSEKKSRTYKKLSERNEAIIVKLADRIANVQQNHIEGREGKFEMYKNEYPEFQKELDRDDATVATNLMWSHLDHLMNSKLGEAQII